jgi:hypothetical protein
VFEHERAVCQMCSLDCSLLCEILQSTPVCAALASFLVEARIASFLVASFLVEAKRIHLFEARIHLLTSFLVEARIPSTYRIPCLEFRV